MYVRWITYIDIFLHESHHSISQELFSLADRALEGATYGLRNKGCRLKVVSERQAAEQIKPRSTDGDRCFRR